MTAPNLSVQFFEPGRPAALLRTLAVFVVGFLIRPIGAFVFGRVGAVYVSSHRLGRALIYPVAVPAAHSCSASS